MAGGKLARMAEEESEPSEGRQPLTWWGTVGAFFVGSLFASVVTLGAVAIVRRRDKQDELPSG